MKKISFALLIFCLNSVLALGQQEGVKRSQPPVETANPSANQEKRVMLMTSMMKEAGFDAELIETYQEMSKKNFTQMIALEQNDKLKQSERDVMMKKIISNEEVQLKKLFGDERFEKYLEMQKQLNDN